MSISSTTQPKARLRMPSSSRALWARAAAFAGAVTFAILAGCATAPEQVAQAPAPAPATPPLVCPPAPKPVCPAPTPTPPPAPPPVEYRGKLVAGAWQELPNWGEEPVRPALEAFVRSCDALEKQDAWKGVCAQARTTLAAADDARAARFFQDNFDPYRVVNPDDTTSGMITGYYEPLLHGSREPSRRYRYPIYGEPSDLLTIDLSSLYPDLNHKRLRGRLVGQRVVPYYSRADIDADPALLKGHEIVWVDDPIDVFFLHIQGSGQVQLENGERVRVGYADQNGHPFRSLGRLLIDRGEIGPEHASMQGIKDWARHHPRKLQRYLDANPSYVFFRELPRDLPGPIGALGVPLTPERSLAVDPRVIPLGAPIYLSTTWPNTSEPLQRLMVAQDTGGAINGAVRADFFWGFGDAAGAQAGKMRQAGEMWVLLPKGFPPPAPAAPAA